MIDTDTLIAGVPLASLIMVVVQLIRELTAGYVNWKGAPAIVLTLVVGPLFTMLAWWLGYLPNWTEWRDALRAGINASIAASGIYAMIKPMVRTTRSRSG